MIRIGEIVKEDKNPLMVVSKEYEEVVRKLSAFDYSSNDLKFLACSIISQTEHQYKKYLIKVLLGLRELKLDELIEDYQKSQLDFNDEKLKRFFSKNEIDFLKDKGIEDNLEKYQPRHRSLFDDNLNNAFYHNKKKGMIILRRLTTFHLKDLASLNNFQKLVFYFIVAQMLDSWESSCIHLGTMILDGWKVEKMTRWFCKVWPIYTN